MKDRNHHPSRQSVGIRSAAFVGTLAVLLMTAATALPDSHEAQQGMYVAAAAGGALDTAIAIGEGGVQGGSSPVGFALRGDVGYRFGDLRVAAQGSYRSHVQKQTVLQAESTTTSSTVGVMATVWYDIPIGGTIVPYVGGGVGMLIRIVSAQYGDAPAVSGTTSRFGTQLGGGVTFGLSDDLDVFVGYRLLLPLPEASLLVLQHNAEIGVAYRF